MINADRERVDRIGRNCRGDIASGCVSDGPSRSTASRRSDAPIKRRSRHARLALTVDVCGTVLTVLAFALALLSGCAGASKPCAAWNGARAAACAVCSLPECPESVSGGEALIDPAELEAIGCE
jgi:hypothetical protein